MLSKSQQFLPAARRRGVLRLARARAWQPSSRDNDGERLQLKPSLHATGVVTYDRPVS